MKYVLALFTVSLMGGSDVNASDFEMFIDKMTGRLLAGEGLASNYGEEILGLPVPDRFKAIVFLRRSGLLVGDEWNLNQLLGETIQAIVSE